MIKNFLRYEDLVCTFIAAIKLQLWASFFESNGPVCLHIKGCTCKEKFWKSVSSPNTFLRWIPTWEEKMAIQGHEVKRYGCFRRFDNRALKARVYFI